MNDFDLKLKQARTRQLRLVGLTIVGLMLMAVSVFGVLVWTNGTSVTILPDEAAENGEVRVVGGFGLAIHGSVYAIGNEPIVEVSAPGFKSEERTISFQEKGQSIEVTLRPLPGRLIAKTNPENTNTGWSVNDRATAIAPSLELELDAGDYQLKVSHPYFKSDQREFHIDRGKDTRLDYELKRIRGQLQVKVLPEDAEISIDDQAHGLSPLNLQLAGGAYQLSITHPDYITKTDIIEVTESAYDVNRSYSLTRKPALLSFVLNPPGGHLIVDGSKVNPQKALSVTSKVEHQVTYLKPGYFGETKTVTLDPSEERSLQINLKPEMGKLEVQASAGASVYINGTLAGKTPFNTKLPAIRHSVSIRKPGYRRVDKKVTLTSNSPVLVKVSLMTELAARLAESPKEYKNTAGITLKLFKPNSVAMGAPRHEKGQRANEFIRNVKLTKPFYVALHEATRGQYAKFKGTSPPIGMDNIPVTAVSWEDSAQFCNWLSKQEKLDPFYVFREGRLISTNNTSDGYRLLTEAEWEWLARRSGRKKQTIFPWGTKSDVPPMAGNIADEGAQSLVDFYVPNYNDGYVEVAPVGSFPKEPSGLFDLVGNVSEWVHDYYSLVPPDKGSTETDPLGMSYGDAHVIKGSNWRSGTRTELRAAYRDGLMSGRDDLGFRVGRYLYGGMSNENAQ